MRRNQKLAQQFGIPLEFAEKIDRIINKAEYADPKSAKVLKKRS